MDLARLDGSLTSSGSGLPWPTSQNGQRRVHLSPIIMKVAVPLPKHSPILGQDASSQTVNRLCSRRIFLMSLKRELGAAAFTRIHSGFFRRSTGIILMGIRDVLSKDFCFLVASYCSSLTVGVTAVFVVIVMSRPFWEWTLRQSRPLLCRQEPGQPCEY